MTENETMSTTISTNTTSSNSSLSSNSSFIDHVLTDYFKYLGPINSFTNLAYDILHDLLKNYKNSCVLTEIDSTIKKIRNEYLASIQALINDINNHNELNSIFKQRFYQEANKELNKLYIFNEYVRNNLENIYREV